MKDGETVSGDFRLPWKRSIAHGITIDKKETTVKDFKSNLNELKPLAPDNFGNMLPDLCWMSFVQLIMICIFNEYSNLQYLHLMINSVMKVKVYKNSSGQLSLHFQANPSEHSWQNSPRSSQLFQASRYTQFLLQLHAVCTTKTVERWLVVNHKHYDCVIKHSLNFS